MTETRSARIRQQIDNVYGSLEQPRFHFTWAALNEGRPTQKALARADVSWATIE